MKRLFPIAATALLLVSCSSPDEPAETSTVEMTNSSTTSSTTSGSTTSSTTTSAAPTRTTETTPAQEPAPEAAPAEQTPAAPAEVAEPYVVECLFGTPGPSLMSDGTTIYTDYCFYENGGPEYLAQESWANSPDNPANQFYYPEPAPAYLTRTPEESQQQAEGQQWWSDCMATNAAEYCRATDPYQQ